MGGQEGDRRSRPSRPSRSSCRRCCKPFKAVPPLVTDIDLSSTTASSMSPAGAPASCASTTSPIRSTRSRPARCGIGGIVRAPRIPAAERRAQRRAADGRGQPRRTARLRHQLALPPWDAQFYPEGIQGWMVKLDADAEGGMSFDPNFFLDSATSGRTRCGCRAATARPTPTATREGMSGLSPGSLWRPRRLPRPQPGHGLAVRGGARAAARAAGADGACRCCRSRWATRCRSPSWRWRSCWPGWWSTGASAADRLPGWR